MANLIGGMIGGILGNKEGTLVYKGTLYLAKTDAVSNLLDGAFEILGQGVTLELISTVVDPRTNTGKTSKSATLGRWILSRNIIATDDIKFSLDFTVDQDFGVPGAFTIRNGHLKEFYLKSLTVELPGGGKTVEFPCNSWVYNASLYKTDRIFFSNELYLPTDTPAGLVQARYNDLVSTRGDGTGTRKDGERIYDYDVYNDLGNPILPNFKRPVLGGSEQLPYPRRCRTGRLVLNGDETLTLTPLNAFYIPADEKFSPTKSAGFGADGLKSVSQSILPIVESLISFDQTFDSFKDVKGLYDRGLDLSKIITAPIKGIDTPFEFINQLTVDKGNNSFIKFPVPQVFKVDQNAWMTDEEFARQTLGGVDPLLIECLKVFPPSSNLDATTYGPQKSSITESHIINFLQEGSVKEAIELKKLFIVSYHDFYMPYLNRINSQRNTYGYASRSLFYLQSDGKLKPVAIELSTPVSQRVFVPPATGQVDWLWELAKAHVTANDSGYHQIVSHWLRTHACLEPFIIATHRQLSAAHPLNPFLKPHFKNTMSINAQARQILINAGGIIERSFTPGRYLIEMSAVEYKNWRFDQEGLPADLLKRGMAVRDSTAKHGLKLTIEDYPYASDGLEIWSCIEKWAHDYVEECYKTDAKVAADTELQAWWKEAINQGHADKKDETWWVKLDNKQNLVQVLSTIIWVASAHHAAVNFGQYAYAGYMPNHPSATHKSIPEENSEEHKKLQAKPENYFLSAVSRKLEAIVVMLTIEILSTHAADEEYLGQRAIDNWTNNPRVKSAFQDFAKSVKAVGDLITSRNADGKLKNRTGPAKVPYTLLYPTSEEGLTGKGIPNSVSI